TEVRRHVLADEGVVFADPVFDPDDDVAHLGQQIERDALCYEPDLLLELTEPVLKLGGAVEFLLRKDAPGVGGELGETLAALVQQRGELRSGAHAEDS